MKRKIMSTTIHAALLSMALAGGQAQAQSGKLSGDMVKIGVMNDMSGLYADIGGPGSVEAAKMAVADFGGKIFGKPIEVVAADHQNKPDVGASKAREWFDAQGVDMIVDVPTSSVGIAVAKVANEKKRAYMNTGSASKALAGC